MKVARTTTLVQGIFNLSKSAVGAGTLSLPWAIARLGLVSGVAVLLFASLATTCTLHFLSRLAANTDVGDFFTLGHMAFGTVGEIVSMVSLILFLFGALIFYIVRAQGYFISFVTFMRPSLALEYKNSLPTILTIITAMLIFPLAAQRDMSTLAKASLAGMVCMGYVLLLTIFDYFYDSATTSVADTKLLVGFGFASFFSVFSDMLFAFVNHFTMLSTVPVMVNPTPKRRQALTIISAAFVFGFYLLVSVAGYLHFGESVNRNILLASKTSNPIMQWAYQIGGLLMGSVLVLSYPLLCDPCRSTIDGAIIKSTGARKGSAIRSLGITAGIIFFSTAIGIFFAKEAEIILAAFTALSGSILVFIFPSAFFLRLSAKYRISPVERILAYACIIFGLFLMVFGTYFNFCDLLKSIRS